MRQKQSFWRIPTEQNLLSFYSCSKDPNILVNEYDERHSLLYGIAEDEDVVIYDMSNYL